VPGNDIQQTVTLTFMEACKGATRQVSINPSVVHSTCGGTGIKPGQKRTTCATCRGTGTVSYVVQGGFTVAASCTVCRGEGSIVPPGATCTGCGGVGRIRQQKTVTVNIPPGLEDGTSVRLTGEGDAPPDPTSKARHGDLFVRVQVIPSKVFRRQGSHLFQEKTIPFYTAILGGKVRVQTLEEDVDIKVPQGTQQGDEVTLRGKGIPKLSWANRGDLSVRFNLSVPRCVASYASSRLC
jgi:molecular chaperone DnaJ